MCLLLLKERDEYSYVIPSSMCIHASVYKLIGHFLKFNYTHSLYTLLWSWYVAHVWCKCLILIAYIDFLQFDQCRLWILLCEDSIWRCEERALFFWHVQSLTSMCCVMLVPQALPCEWTQLHPSNQGFCQMVQSWVITNICEWIAPTYTLKIFWHKHTGC